MVTMPPPIMGGPLFREYVIADKEVDLTRGWFRIWPRYKPGDRVRVVRMPHGQEDLPSLVGFEGTVEEVEELFNGYTNYTVDGRYLNDVMLEAVPG